MKVKCIANSIEQIPSESARQRLEESIKLDGPNYDLKIGIIYPVVAVSRWKDGGLRVYLHTVEEIDYPFPYPVEMFEVINEGGSNYEEKLEESKTGFPSWSDEFYEQLIEGDQKSTMKYKSWRLLNRGE